MAKKKEPARQFGNLVQIDPNIVPATHQSTENLMGCKKNYATQVIEGRRNPGGIDSARGTEIHHTMSLYLSHCSRNQRAVDLAAFDEFAKGAGVEASKILVGVRDSYMVDYAHLLATEETIYLDEDFRPCSKEKAAYQGTLDASFAFRDLKKIQVDDFKSHPKPYDPADSHHDIQGKMYAVLSFQTYPWAEEVTFRLVFVRYKSLIKEVTYYRKDLPRLIEAVASLRHRQKSIHDDYIAGKEMQATGNQGCFYCPLLTNLECPILQQTPESQMTPQEWVSANIVYSTYLSINKKRMKEYVQATGRKIVLKDYNGKSYVYGPVPRESLQFPLFKRKGKSIEWQTDSQGNPVRPVMPIVDLFIDHAYATPEDTDWLGNILLSSSKINSYRKAKDRAILDQALQDTADRIPKAKMEISKPLDVLPSDVEEELKSEREFEGGDDDEEEEFA